MRKAAVILIALILFIAVLPSAVSAQPSNAELTNYLNKVSKERGFTVTQADLERSLNLYDATLDEFNIEDLEYFLGDVIQADGSNLISLYQDYQLKKADVETLLKKNGQTIDEFIFVDNLYFTIDDLREREPDFDQKLESYLEQVSQTRGFTVTNEQIASSLSLYDASLDDFKTVTELSDFLNEVIKADLSNLPDYFAMSLEDILQIMEENNLDINDYIFLDDLANDLDGFIYWEDDFIDLAFFMEQYDLTEEELIRLEEHILSIPDITSDETIERILDLSYRLMDFADFETVTELAPAQVAELLSIYKEFISIFELKTEFMLVRDGAEEPLSLEDLLSLTELVNASLKVNIYNLQGDFLADLIITGEMVDSDALHETGGSLNEVISPISHTITSVEKEVITAPTVIEREKTEKETPAIEAAITETENRLPDTATNYANYALIGLILLLAGGGVLFLARRQKDTA
ncbi:processed acidic surface protein [Gracilibacillus alcaliphilus]|uniref:processed acidic surface protein n=1 Tax=Gracilibacillus alcaliphilus TaxID=1401441 RepID=UPI001956FD2B|nr:processed acidic surface protein [Gracilibacillus alcaliphilus]MBM7679007.1 processed acidic surface protein [Gracilibacillus alcaliphilus]